MRKGYTLVELLVVMFVLVTIMGIGVLSYRDFNRRQQVIAAARLLRSDLRLAQTESLAGKKPENCDTATSVLNGYNFRRLSSTSYTVEAVCVNPNRTVTVRTVNLPPNTTMNNFNTIFFKPIGDGTSIPSGSSITITVNGTGTSYTEVITIRSSGDIL